MDAMIRTTDGLPPGPPLPRVVQLALMMLFWPRYVAACGRRYGNAFTLRFASMGTWVYLADPSDIKTVFAGDPTVYHAGEANAVMSGLLGDSSVLVVDEDRHRDRRGLMLAPFQRDAVTAQAQAMADIAIADIEDWPVGTEFPVGPRMSRITLDVILRTVIGTTDPARLAALREVMPRLLNMGAWDTVALTKPELLRRRPWRGLRRRIEEADRLLYAEIAERRVDPDLATRTDMLAKLVRAADQDGRGISDSELRDQLVTLLFAGHDTTATSLSWALERLTRHPAVLDKAVRAAEASAAGDPEGDAYLDAIAKETLRIRPVAFEAGRLLTRPVESPVTRCPQVSWLWPRSDWSTEARIITVIPTSSTQSGCSARA
jgi:cytochrome P450 family 135